MPRWRLTRGLVDAGVWTAPTQAEALLLRHRMAGFGAESVWLDGDSLSFVDADTEDMLGDVSAWSFEQVTN